MLTISDKPTFTREVTVNVPVDGGYHKETFSATFVMLSTDEYAAHDLDSEAGAREFLETAIDRLDDIAGDDGKVLDWSNELRDKALGIPYVRAALAAEYWKSVSGAREGN